MEINKLLIFQVSIHIFSIAYLYIYFFKNDKKEVKKNCKTSSKVDANCFKQQCSKAATENECSKYARCTWANSCKAKELQCEELQPKNKPVDRFNCKNAAHCKLEGDTCTWNRELLQSGPAPKIINETTGLNKYCLKRQGTFKMKNLNEFVEDQSYVQCLNSSDTTQKGCEQNAKIKLECNSLEGHTFNESNAVCQGLKFSTTKVKERAKVPPHDHTREVLEATANVPKNGFMSNLFILKEENVLKYYVNTFILVVVILTNIGFAKLIRNR